MKALTIVIILFSVCFFPQAPESNVSVKKNDDFVLIDGGSFTMGCVDQEKCRKMDTPAHTVTLSAFYFSKYEVSQLEYEGIMGFNPSIQKRCQDCPVNRVGWLDAIIFCNKKSDLEGYTPYYTINKTDVSINPNSNGYRLPTEAEWEFVASANTRAQNDYLLEMSKSCFNETSRRKLRPVSKGEANTLGVHNIFGNVWEWCYDGFQSYSGKVQHESNGADKSRVKVIRGGGYLTSARVITPWFRSRDQIGARKADYGIRLARNYPK